MCKRDQKIVVGHQKIEKATLEPGVVEIVARIRQIRARCGDKPHQTLLVLRKEQKDLFCKGERLAVSGRLPLIFFARLYHQGNPSRLDFQFVNI